MNRQNYERPKFFQKRYHVTPSTIYWTTCDGEVLTLSEMKDSHVQNTLNYITRRSQQWESARTLAEERTGTDIGEYIINGKLGVEWFDLFVAEIKRRQEA